MWKALKRWAKQCPLWHRPSQPNTISISWRLAAFDFSAKTRIPELDEKSGFWVGRFVKTLTLEGEVDTTDTPDAALLTLTLPATKAASATTRMLYD